MKKIMIAGTSSGSGKTLITLGLLKILQQRGFEVQPYKVGPDYIDTQYHTRVVDRQSRNLDMFIVNSRTTMQQLFYQSNVGADISVVEGVMGLFDGFGVDKDYCSSAGVAKQLDIPVILVVNGKSAATSVAATIKGFLEFDPELNIVGVIINQLSSENHYQLIKKAVEIYTETKVFGYLPKIPELYLPSRQLGLVPDREIDDLMLKVDETAAQLEKTVAIDDILKEIEKEDIFGTIKPVWTSQYPDFSDLTLAYAYDDAFHFYYPDNLELLEKFGVNLTSFSPIADKKLPAADFYYFGGGYPEEFAAQLSDNQQMRIEILRKHQESVPILAECGGLMYLGEHLKINNIHYEMVGIFKGFSQMTTGLKNFGYCYGLANQDTLIADKGEKIVGHEFHHSIFESDESTVLNMFKERDGQVIKAWHGGYQKNQTFASYLHLHFYQSSTFLTKLLERVRQLKKVGSK